MDFTFRRSYRGRVKAVILDWAGTAVDYGSFAPTAVFLSLFKSRGVTITPEDVRFGMGLMKKDHLRVIINRPAVAAAWDSVHGAPPTEEMVEDLFQDFMPMQNAVLAEYADPIPGLLDSLEDIRADGIKIGSTTGYLRSMMDVLAPEAARRGYTPDCIVCSDEVPAGRPYPWMCFQNAIDLGIYPMQAIVKIGDTLPDIEEGLNAGAWTVGISLTGNLLGLSLGEFETLSREDQEKARNRIEAQFYQAGAHEVIDGIWNLPEILDKIEKRLRRGEQP